MTTTDRLRGAIFNIQRYSIHDGPGIRTTVFLKGCPLKCFWCQNPESQRRQPEIFLDKSKCTCCGQCVAACSNGASSLGEQSSIINRDICTGCGTCVKACPNEARSLIGKYLSLEEVWQVIKKDMRFYENSNGGVTLSGGEPTAQPRFVQALLQQCKQFHLHTTLDTCGYVRWSTLEKILEHVDLVLYDIKHMDPRKHLRGTGVSNKLISCDSRLQ